jgi:hypothetical protein
MKAKLFFIGLLLAGMATVANAQIPNSGFETWIKADSLSEWFSGNVASSTDHYPESVGNYSVKLTNQLPVTSHLSYGFAVSGGKSSGCVPSFPVTGHPSKLCGYYKCFPVNGDTIQLGIELFKNGVWIAGGELTTTDTVANWTSFTIPISAYTEADSANVTIAAFYNDTTCGFPHGPYGNSVLYIDNISFDNLITSTVNTSANVKEVSVYPNPAGNAIQVTGVQGKVTLKLLDVNGRLLFTKEVTANETVPVSFLPNGLYMATIKSNDVAVTQKFIIKK